MTKEDLFAILDMNWREKAVFAPLILMVFWMGLYPPSFLDVMSASVENLIVNYEAALAASAGGPDVAALPLGKE
jgi:NADH-quinone oxidoreductase subunit M